MSTWLPIRLAKLCKRTVPQLMPHIALYLYLLENTQKKSCFGINSAVKHSIGSPVMSTRGTSSLLQWNSLRNTEVRIKKNERSNNLDKSGQHNLLAVFALTCCRTNTYKVSCTWQQWAHQPLLLYVYKNKATWHNNITFSLMMGYLEFYNITLVLSTWRHFHIITLMMFFCRQWRHSKESTVLVELSGSNNVRKEFDNKIHKSAYYHFVSHSKTHYNKPEMIAALRWQIFTSFFKNISIFYVFVIDENVKGMKRGIYFIFIHII